MCTSNHAVLLSKTLSSPERNSTTNLIEMTVWHLRVFSIIKLMSSKAHSRRLHQPILTTSSDKSKTSNFELIELKGFQLANRWNWSPTRRVFRTLHMTSMYWMIVRTRAYGPIQEPFAAHSITDSESPNDIDYFRQTAKQWPFYHFVSPKSVRIVCVLQKQKVIPVLQWDKTSFEPDLCIVLSLC